MSIKRENEITLKVNCSIEELSNMLGIKGFKVVDKFTMNDIFMVPVSLKNNISNFTSREILKQAILIRDLKGLFSGKISKKLTFKKKEFDENGDIISQESVNCAIKDANEAEKFLNAINYYKIMNIKESDVVYGKDDLEIAIKDIENGDTLIEVETVSNNPNIDTVEKLKSHITSLGLPLDTSNFFVKKAEVELDKIINNSL